MFSRRFRRKKAGMIMIESFEVDKG